jgi:4-aminobutyrate aminotransferase-like enzyme
LKLFRNAYNLLGDPASRKLSLFVQVVFFTNSGTEANELALMIARLYTGSHDIISLRNGYHGNAAGTMGATAQSNWKFNVVQVGACFVSGTHKISLVSSQKKKDFTCDCYMQKLLRFCSYLVLRSCAPLFKITM